MMDDGRLPKGVYKRRTMLSQHPMAPAERILPQWDPQLALPKLTEASPVESVGSSEPHYCSFAQSWLTFCDPMDCSTPGLPVHHQLLEPTQTHVH